MNKLCQSCGMPLKRDPNGGGSNADGSQNSDYCSHCYVDGAFAQPDINAEKMRQLCIDNITAGGVPRIMARLLTKRIAKLKRWST
ncbi:MAG: zinc ribbon domain-containing protein [Thiotrichaceae bacterium]|nr:zinc ribbon domain-containing protein [Thiotrichaceae bacterium]PCI13588.1 MAG: hypothetical protein COB71_05435 [Thiotrichales bacterium]